MVHKLNEAQRSSGRPNGAGGTVHMPPITSSPRHGWMGMLLGVIPDSIRYLGQVTSIFLFISATCNRETPCSPWAVPPQLEGDMARAQPGHKGLLREVLSSPPGTGNAAVLVHPCPGVEACSQCWGRGMRLLSGLAGCDML